MSYVKKYWISEIFVLLASLFMMTACTGESTETQIEDHKSAELSTITTVVPDVAVTEVTVSKDFQDFPQIEQVEPPLGSNRGETLHIYGNHFVLGIQVSLGGTPCSPVQVHSPTHLECQTKSTRAKVAHVILTNPSGHRTILEYGFEFVEMSQNEHGSHSPLNPIFQSYSAPNPSPSTHLSRNQYESIDPTAPPMESMVVKNSSDRREIAHHFLESLPHSIEKTNSNLALWRRAADLRTQSRNQVISALRGVHEYYQERSESIMRNEVTRAYLESISHLEDRYPFAVPNAQAALKEIYQMVEHLDVSSQGTIGTLKKEAALRYLDRVLTHHSLDRQFHYNFREIPLYDPHQSGLTYTETLALIWAAINDRSIFVHAIEFQDRKWGLLDSLAHIQRAHNDSSGSVSFNLSHEEDQPSCGKGTFKRILESLDGLHPDVRLNVSTRVTNQMAFSAIQRTHQYLFSQEPADTQRKIRQSSESQGEDYQRYLVKLRAEVRKSSSNISPEQLEMNTNALSMEALLGQ
jgi:hypothetical protein